MDMEHVFSMEEIFGPFWDLPSPPLEQPLVPGFGSVTDDGVVTHGSVGEGGDMMNQNTTEWTFEGLLEEQLLTTNTASVTDPSFSPLNVDPVVEVNHGTVALPAAVSAVGDPMEYNAQLKRKLEEDLMAFKMWKASSAVNSEGSNNDNNGGSKNLVQNNLNVEDPINDHAENADLSVKLSTSSSSRDPSPTEEDMDGEVEILGFKMPTEERLRKRKESNRESARRSRYRKALHLKDLENQVERLKAENSCLLRRLAAMNKKYNDATVDNRVLKADMETLKAKMKMGEDSLKQAMETNSQPSIPISALNSSDASLTPIQDNDIVNYFMTTPAGDASVENSFMPMPADQLQLQAEEPTISGALNTTTEMVNQIATLQEPELLGPDETINMDM